MKWKWGFLFIWVNGIRLWGIILIYYCLRLIVFIVDCEFWLERKCEDFVFKSFVFLFDLLMDVVGVIFYCFILKRLIFNWKMFIFINYIFKLFVMLNSCCLVGIIRGEF